MCVCVIIEIVLQRFYFHNFVLLEEIKKIVLFAEMVTVDYEKKNFKNILTIS